jgi:hypothetical protein
MLRTAQMMMAEVLGRHLSPSLAAASKDDEVFINPKILKLFSLKNTKKETNRFVFYILRLPM